MSNSREAFEEAFAHEIESWCHGLRSFPGEISNALLHRTIRELAPALFVALRNGHVFDIVEIAEKFCQVTKYLIPEKEIVYSILVRLPNPKMLTGEDQLYALGSVVDKVDQKYPGALRHLHKRWSNLDKKASDQARAREEAKKAALEQARSAREMVAFKEAARSDTQQN